MKRLATLAALLLLVSGIAQGQKRKTPHSDPQRDAALASLRAVRSALDAGATLDEFRKYQIESRIKIDAMPSTPANRDLREVSDLYNAAVQFGVIRVSGEISGAEIASAKARYGTLSDDVLFKSILGALDKMTPSAATYIDPNLSPEVKEEIRYQLEKNRIAGEQIARLLIASADERLRKLK